MVLGEVERADYLVNGAGQTFADIYATLSTVRGKADKLSRMSAAFDATNGLASLQARGGPTALERSKGA